MSEYSEKRGNGSTFLYRSKLWLSALISILILVVIGIGFVAAPRFNRSKMQARSKACRANMRVLEGAVDMWEMDTDGERMPSGVFVDGEGEVSSLGRRLAPNYVKKMPRCRMGGTYIYDDEICLVFCTVHGCVDGDDLMKILGEKLHLPVDKYGDIALTRQELTCPGNDTVSGYRDHLLEVLRKREQKEQYHLILWSIVLTFVVALVISLPASKLVKYGPARLAFTCVSWLALAGVAVSGVTALYVYNETTISVQIKDVCILLEYLLTVWRLGLALVLLVGLMHLGSRWKARVNQISRETP